MADLFPPAEPYESGSLDVGDGQTLYWETVGSATGQPVVYLHGGPGSGSTTGARRYFDPDTFRAVLFDQRGCGRSRPLASDDGADLSTNTTAHLVADIERLRIHLGIDRWIVVGISWGVTLAFVYAQAHPDRVSAMVLGAVTSGSRREIEWITRDMGRVFPREWETFSRLVSSEQRKGDLSTAYSRLLSDPDASVREHAAREWCRWEDTHVSLMPGWKPARRYEDAGFRMVFARLVTHYWSHDCFLDEGQVLAGMDCLANIPGVMIHGRYDVSGPLDTAWSLRRRWPASRLVVLDDAGHGGGSFTNELVSALNSIAAVI